MKTSLELSDAIYQRVRKQAQKTGRTIREIIEQGIELALRSEPLHSKKNKPKYREFIYGTGGLTREAEKMSWGEIRALASRERGVMK